MQKAYGNDRLEVRRGRAKTHNDFDCTQRGWLGGTVVKGRNARILRLDNPWAVASGSFWPVTCDVTRFYYYLVHNL